MPLIRVQLSVELDEAKQSKLMSELSSTVASALGKPEGYMMVVLEQQTPMLLGASSDPAALVEIRSVGSISGDQARDLSGKVSEVIGGAAGIGADRIYSNFEGVPGAMWGYNGATFG